MPLYQLGQRVTLRTHGAGWTITGSYAGPIRPEYRVHRSGTGSRIARDGEIIAAEPEPEFEIGERVRLNGLPDQAGEIVSKTMGDDGRWVYEVEVTRQGRRIYGSRVGIHTVQGHQINI